MLVTITPHVFSQNLTHFHSYMYIFFYTNMHACTSSRMRKRAKHEQKYIAIFMSEESPINRLIIQSLFYILALFSVLFNSKYNLSKLYIFLIDTFITRSHSMSIRLINELENLNRISAFSVKSDAQIWPVIKAKLC